MAGLPKMEHNLAGNHVHGKASPNPFHPEVPGHTVHPFVLDCIHCLITGHWHPLPALNPEFGEVKMLSTIMVKK